MSLLTNLFRKKSVESALANAGHDFEGSGGALKKDLRVFDLTALGIAAIIGAGIFSTIGSASFSGGPGVVFLFIFTAVACGFAAFAYAEFASMLPVSGSAYTYSYVAFGELIAWIIGWALIMEYAVGNITVAVSWSGYFTSLCASMGLHIPAWMTVDYTSAHEGYNLAVTLLQDGADPKRLTDSVSESYNAWTTAPAIGGLRLIADVPAIVMSILVTMLVYRGIRESKTASNAMVLLKMSVVLLVILVGAFYVDVKNWDPFLPNGFGGVMAGVSSVFFAYIGFDALSTTAEECKNPQRDLPRAMVYSIIICTILYVIIALILTGMVNYTELKVDDPLAYVFKKINMPWFSGVIAISAVAAMAGVFLVFQIGQPRIWMTMSRDGLLPKRFSHIHPRYQTPDYATIVTGFVVVVPMLFIPSGTVLDLCSMGTLFAFVLVCAGVLKLQVTPGAPRGKFRTPYINAKWIFPAALIGIATWLGTQHYTATMDWITNNDYTADVAGWDLFKHKIPMWLFIITCFVVAVLSFRLNFSLIPVLGLTCCLYMMVQISATSWAGFMVWLIIGLVIYFTYGYKNSRLNVNVN
jgi:basic amino acid/polyamine antiporter, APA family